jgi:hypothetical protein
MAVLPNQILRKKIYAKQGWMALCARFIYYTSTLTVQKIFMKVKGMATQGRIGVYILSGLSAMGVYDQWLLTASKKWQNYGKNHSSK